VLLPALRPLLALLLAGVLALAACGEGDDPATQRPGGGASPPEAADGAAEAGCERVRAPAPRSAGALDRPSDRLAAGRTYVARVSTSCGAFEITLDARRAPRTGGSFLSLARQDFYDGTTFHRIVPGFVIQGGDPEGSGTGGPGYAVEEAPPQDLVYSKGVVAMAKTAAEEPGTSGSQFFVVTGEDAQLPPEYALLGRVTAGMDVVDRIAAVPVGPEDRPVEPVVIRDVTVTAR
jgi:cyclophilin family peptidyl-prolyl cis-trans isomerase